MTHLCAATRRPLVTGSVAAGLLQRQCACGDHSFGAAECENCRGKRGALLRSSINSSQPLAVPPMVHDVVRSAGEPLAQETRAFFEPRLGNDFTRVRLHTDTRAANSARSINAHAYTVGDHIAFQHGRYDPPSING